MKSQKNQRIANVIFGIAATLFGAASLIQVDQMPQPGSDIFSPATTEVGVMTVFSVQGSDAQWIVIPQVPMTVYGEDNSFMATSFQKAGTYTVVAAYQVKGKTELRSALIHVGVQPPSEPEDAPEIEVGEPEEPVAPPPPPSTSKYPEVKPYVLNSAKASELNKESAKQLSNNFLMIARDIGEGAFETARQVTTATAIANRRLNLTSQTAIDIQLTISDLKFKGDLVTLADYQDLWTQIGEGLKDYAGN
jgi:hypothetical protein